MARPPKFDYDSDDFYDEILALSMQGLTDAEIADNLEDKFKTSLPPEVFCCMNRQIRLKALNLNLPNVWTRSRFVCS